MAGASTGENSAYPSFSSRIAFIIVTAGSAVGLGNVWGFPYVAGQNGGGGFVLNCFLALALAAVMSHGGRRLRHIHRHPRPGT